MTEEEGGGGEGTDKQKVGGGGGGLVNRDARVLSRGKRNQIYPQESSIQAVI